MHTHRSIFTWLTFLLCFSEESVELQVLLPVDSGGFDSNLSFLCVSPLSDIYTLIVCVFVCLFFFVVVFVASNRYLVQTLDYP